MARPTLGDGPSERIQMVISTEDLSNIDDWRFDNRVQSRSEAIRLLCKLALLRGVSADEFNPNDVRKCDEQKM